MNPSCYQETAGILGAGTLGFPRWHLQQDRDILSVSQPRAFEEGKSEASLGLSQGPCKAAEAAS